MIILKETILSQNFKFISRIYEADTLVLKNETTGEQVTYEISPIIDRYYLEVDLVLDLKQDNFYQMTVKNGSDVVYKDKVFCTNQIIEDFSVNKDVYKGYQTTNDYITYE